MHTPLGLEQAVGEPALDRESDRRESGFLTVLVLGDLEGETALVGPALIHLEQHRRPVLGIGATGTRVDLADRIALVVLPGVEGPQLELGELGLERGDDLLGLGHRVFVALFVGQHPQRLDVVDARCQAVVEVEVFLDLCELGLDLTSEVGVVPQIGAAHLGLELWQTRAELTDAQIVVGLGEFGAQTCDGVGEIRHGGTRRS